jgi:beta-mannosidase
MLHRQHFWEGQKVIAHQIKLHLPLPDDVNATSAFSKMLYLAQINQAVSVKTQTESYRRLKGEMLENGEGHNAGQRKSSCTSNLYFCRLLLIFRKF